LCKIVKLFYSLFIAYAGFVHGADPTVITSNILLAFISDYQ